MHHGGGRSGVRSRSRGATLENIGPAQRSTPSMKTHLRAGDKTYCGRALTFPCIDLEREVIKAATCQVCQRSRARETLKFKAVATLRGQLGNV